MNQESIEQNDLVQGDDHQEFDVNDTSVLSTVRNSEESNTSDKVIDRKRWEEPSEKVGKKANQKPGDREKVENASVRDNNGHNFQVEVHLRRLRILIAPIMDYFPNFPRNNGKIAFTVYISRSASIGTLHKKIVQSLVNFATNNGRNHPIKFLLQWSRIWKIDWSREVSFSDITRMAQDVL